MKNKSKLGFKKKMYSFVSQAVLGSMWLHRPPSHLSLGRPRWFSDLYGGSSWRACTSSGVWFRGSEWSLEICISNRLPDGASAILQTPDSQKSGTVLSRPQMRGGHRFVAFMDVYNFRNLGLCFGYLRADLMASLLSRFPLVAQDDLWPPLPVILPS